MTEDINSRAHPTNDGDRVKEVKFSRRPSDPSIQKKKKKTHKHPCLEEEAGIEEREEEIDVHDDNNVNVKDKEAEDIPHPNPKAEPFLPAHQKGGKRPILRATSV